MSEAVDKAKANPYSRDLLIVVELFLVVNLIIFDSLWDRDSHRIIVYGQYYNTNKTKNLQYSNPLFLLLKNASTLVPCAVVF